MKTILSLSLAATVWLMSQAATAQTAGDVGGAIFSDLEKRIIREHFGKDPNATQDDGQAPDWAVRDGGEDEADGEKDKAEKKDKKDKGKDKGDKKGDKKGNGKEKGLPPGLAKRDQLPPGLARQLKEKGRLPPGLAKRDLPADLSAKLPARPADQDVTIVENDVVLVDQATGIVLDVIKDVVNGSIPNVPNTDGTLPPPGDQTGEAQPNLLDTVLQNIFGGNK